MSRLHEAWLEEPTFHLVWTQRKQYLVLVDEDARYRPGDVVMLLEHIGPPTNEYRLDLTGVRQLLVLIVYSEHQPDGVRDGFTAMGVKLLARLTNEEHGFEAEGAPTVALKGGGRLPRHKP